MTELAALVLGAGIFGLGVVVGAGLMYKGKASVPGERFLGGVPKGEVFSIAEAEENPETPEETVLKRTEKFLKVLGGKTDEG